MTRAELIDHLKAAEGPSRELDAEIAEICGIRVERNHWTQYTQEWAPYIYDWMGCHKHPLPDFTSSIDAALALVEQCLPGWELGFYKMRTGHTKVEIRRWQDIPPYRYAGVGPIEAPTPPIALLIALLTALTAKENGDE
jgi:hypothetical protein